MLYNQKKTNILILVSFILSSLLSVYYVNKYDNFSLYKNNKHPMIKIAVHNHWAEAQILLDDIKDGKKFWESGKKKTDSFLPQKLLALFYLLIDEDLEENDITKIENGKTYYLILKSLFYYFVIYLLSKKLNLIFSKKKTFFTILFLALAPDILQYHSSFWNESLFFSFQLLLIYFFIINDENKFINNIAIGITAGLMYSISEEYFIYIIFLSIVYLLIFRKKFLKPLLCLLIGYFFIIIIIFSSNSFKGRPDKVVAYGIKTAFYLYLVPNIVSEKENTSIEESFKILKNDAKDWANKNNIIYSNESHILLEINDVDQKKQYLDYLFKKSIILILKNPIITLKKIFPKYLHTGTLNPFYVKYFYQFDGKGEFLKTDTHKNLIPVRIIYSLLIYLVIFIGFLKSFKTINSSIIIFLIISTLYVILSLGWFGNPRYFTPALLFLSIFFGNFFNDKNKYSYKTN